MTKHNALLLKIDFVLAFIDLKVWLLLWVFLELYRNTILLGGLNGRRTMHVAKVLTYVWQEVGSPYLIWIPIVVITDIFLKRLVKSLL
ncbi:MAG: hypothetical protein M9962_11240 [Oligoflexia bacterium]|nr:hypothetical protein [Oligoflexia bacterium]